MKNVALSISGIIFLIAAALHLYRYLEGTELVINHISIPQDWSLYGCIISGLLAILMLVALRK